MVVNSSKNTKEEAVFHLNNNNFPQAIHEEQIAKTQHAGQHLLVHFDLEDKDVNPSHDADSSKPKNAPKETLKMLMAEFLFLPISLISSGCVQGAVHLLHYHHIYVLSFLMAHVVSWFSSSLSKNLIRRLVAFTAPDSLMVNFIRQYV